MVSAVPLSNSNPRTTTSGHNKQHFLITLHAYVAVTHARSFVTSASNCVRIQMELRTYDWLLYKCSDPRKQRKPRFRDPDSEFCDPRIPLCVACVLCTKCAQNKQIMFNAQSGMCGSQNSESGSRNSDSASRSEIPSRTRCPNPTVRIPNSVIHTFR